MSNIDLRDGIIKCVKDYQKVTMEKVVKIGKKVSKKGKEDLKKTSPVGHSNNKKLRDGWTTNTVIEGNKATFVVRNKNKPHIVHLLEHGHINKNGTRTRGFNFVEPVREEMENEFIEKLGKEIESGN